MFWCGVRAIVNSNVVLDLVITLLTWGSALTSLSASIFARLITSLVLVGGSAYTSCLKVTESDHTRHPLHTATHRPQVLCSHVITQSGLEYDLERSLTGRNYCETVRGFPKKTRLKGRHGTSPQSQRTRHVCKHSFKHHGSADRFQYRPDGAHQFDPARLTPQGRHFLQKWKRWEMSTSKVGFCFVHWDSVGRWASRGNWCGLMCGNKRWLCSTIVARNRCGECCDLNRV